MNRIAFLLASCLALFSSAHPQNKSAAELAEEAAQGEVHRQELVSLERETARAIQLNNATFFRRVYSEDFVGIPASGLVMDKSALLASIQTSDATYSSFIASDIQVRIYQDTAVVNCLWTARGILHAQTVSRQSRVIHVYIYGARGWQAVASQETLLPGQGH